MPYLATPLVNLQVKPSFAKIAECTYTCCACYSSFTIIASTISLNGNRRQSPPWKFDRPFIKIYEDNAKGNLSDEHFTMMSKTYEDEQAQLKVEMVNLQKEVEVQERQIENLEQFIQWVRRYTTLTELTPYALRALVKAIYVDASDKSSGKRKHKVYIEYDLVGYIPVDELIKAEQA